ncbi:MAG: hypothetical protein KGH66_02965 [Candidatus Micrarchaeota archaeon]|nr:hypothetical protein [Candidatus Micrarchaeota archaeon]
MAKQKLLGFRVELVHDSDASQDKIKTIMRGYGIKYLRVRSPNELSGRTDELNADKAFDIAKRLKRDVKKQFIEVTVSPLYSN